MSPVDHSAIKAPNLFTLQGHNTSVTISLSGIDGKPRFTYHDQHQALSFSGDEIEFEECSLGSLVTVPIVRTVDFGTTLFSVVLPSMNLLSGSNHVQTIGITALHRTTLGGVGHGQLTTYTTITMHGSAQQVEFLAAANP